MPRTSTASSSISYSSLSLGILIGILLTATALGFFTFVQLIQTPTKPTGLSSITPVAHIVSNKDDTTTSNSVKEKDECTDDTSTPGNTPPQKVAQATDADDLSPKTPAQPVDNTKSTKSQPSTPSPETPTEAPDDDTSQQKSTVKVVLDTVSDTLDTVKTIDIRL